MKTRKILSLFLALLLCAGLLPFPAMAQDAWDSMGFTCINITNAGAQDSMSYSWAEGRYPDLTGANNLSSGNLKYRTMVKAQILYEENRYYLPSSKADTTHELTLYGTESVEPETISISNVTVLSGFTRASYGSGKGTLYYYVAKISVPASGCQAVIKIGGKTLSTLALRRVIHYSGIPLVSTIWTKDYTEEAGRITECVLRVSGFSIYSKEHPEWYTLRK